MKNNFIPKFILSAIFLFSSAVAFADPPNPGICPNVSAIRAVGLTKTIPLDKGFYADYSLSNYGTNDNWVFFVGSIKATSFQDALKKGNAALPFLSGLPKPHEFNDEWVCSFSIGSGYQAFAVYPAPANFSKSSLSSLIN